MNKIYKGSENELANFITDLYRAMTKWFEKHPNYRLIAEIKDGLLYVTITKTFNENETSTPVQP